MFHVNFLDLSWVCSAQEYYSLAVQLPFLPCDLTAPDIPCFCNYRLRTETNSQLKKNYWSFVLTCFTRLDTRRTADHRSHLCNAFAHFATSILVSLPPGPPFNSLYIIPACGPAATRLGYWLQLWPNLAVYIGTWRMYPHAQVDCNRDSSHSM